MMKLMLPITFMIYSKTNLSLMNMVLTSCMIMMFFNLIMQSNSIMVMNSFFLYDYMSLILILLSILSTILIMTSSNLKFFTKISISSILIILIITFSCDNMLLFYMSFELVLIPTIILITKMGKQPERLQASIYLLMYTILSSLPLLVGILYWSKSLSFMFSSLMNYKFTFFILFIMAFLIKMPMFFTHLWLPKAHVEAPLEGSMILAAILLKLGGYGLIRFMPLIMNKLNNFSHWLMSISLIGASITGFNCMRQKDMKSLIAYSSVSHMSLVLASIMSMNKMGLNGAMMMMISHGLSSSAMFLLVNSIYEKYHTRNILCFKGLLSMFPNLTFWWFIFTMINMSAPPSISIMSEIMIIMSTISWSMINMMTLFMVSMTTATFSIILFSNMSHNHSMFNLPLEMSLNKIFLSLFIHLYPLIFMIMKMEIFMKMS